MRISALIAATALVLGAPVLTDGFTHGSGRPRKVQIPRRQESEEEHRTQQCQYQHQNRF